MPPRSRKPPAEQWWAVVAADGALVSVGSVVADPLPDGRSGFGVGGGTTPRATVEYSRIIITALPSVVTWWD